MLELGDLRGAYSALAALYGQRLSLSEAMNLLLIQLDYESRIGAWEAMLPYVNGKLPLMIHADEVRQIKSAVHWAATNHYKMVLAGGRDAWMAADLLASNKVPLVYVHTFTQPVRDTESYDVHFAAPELLRKAGVQVAFCNGLGTMDAALTKNLPYYAAQAVAFGLPADEALKGITLYPAQIAGVADRLGSIETGKEATLFAADGDLFDGLVALQRDFDLVRARLDRCEHVFTAFVGNGRTRDVGLFVGQRHFDARQHAAGVFDGSAQSALEPLTVHRRSGERGQERAQ